VRIRFISWQDGIAIAAVLLIAFLLYNVLFFPGAGNAVNAEIWVNGELTKTVPLGQPVTFHHPVSGVEIAIGHSARFMASDCRDQFCVRVGSLLTSGNAAVCLPNRIVLRIVGADGLDAVVG
jgi:hypothetical protein